MSDNTKILDLPLIQGGQAQKHITHNEALRRLDALVQAVALDMDRTEPPTLPDEGDRHLIATGAQGDWLGLDAMLAVREGDAWAYIAPAQGWQVHVIALGAVVTFDGDGWAQPGQASIGINAAADTTNRLTVAADATLLTHDGAGHQLKINKSAPGETNSLLFQTGFAGRAEMGCAGSDGFSIKVSPDGSAWNTAVETDPATGTVSFPSGARVTREVPFGGRWACMPDNRWITFNRFLGMTTDTNNTSSGNGPEPDLNWQAMGPFVAGGTTLARVKGLLRASSSTITGYDLRVHFQTGPLTGAWNNDPDTTRTLLHSANGVPISQNWHTCDAPLGDFAVPQDGYLLVYFRPLGTITSSEFIYSVLTLHLIG